MDVVYKGNRKRRIKKEVLIVLIFIGALLIGAGVYWLVRQRVASQQEAGGLENCPDGTGESRTICNENCPVPCIRCRKEYTEAYYCPVPLLEEDGKQEADVDKPAEQQANTQQQEAGAPSGQGAKPCDACPWTKAEGVCPAGGYCDGCKAPVGEVIGNLRCTKNGWVSIGAGGSSGGAQAQECDPNYVIPVSIKSFTQTSGICLQGQTYEAAYTVVIEAGAAANECGGGHYSLRLVFPPTFGNDFVKSASPAYTVTTGTVNWWTYTYDNNTITHTVTIRTDKSKITSPSFQVSAILEEGDHVSVKTPSKAITSYSQGCYTTQTTSTNNVTSNTQPTPTPTPTYNYYNTYNTPTPTPPPTPQGVASSLLGVFAGISLITLGVLDQQYEFVSRLFKKEHVV